ncbi:molybdate ABC transporter substrate-binding protein [Nocardioides sp. GCM10027113]|uniref:molybdate ABC transporter substrate-binding protein n=1 Tax=unclassified Nocardioides TaxID=2615069 RepID=UPI0036118EE1
MRTRPALPALLLATLLPVALAGCAADGEDTLTVLAAASLTDVFSELAEDFEAAHPGTEVELVLGSSTDLAENAADGAPGDVLATADAASVRLAVDAGSTAADPVTFATNVLVLVTAPGNPAGLEGLADLDGVTWVRCADDVPCGRVALSLLEGAGVEARPASLEVDVRATLEKVVSGEADAGLVYASDAVAAGADVATVPVAGAEAVPASYHLAPLVQAEDAELADDWVELVTSDQGRQVLRDAGFTVP